MVYCTISTNSSVTGHNSDWRDGQKFSAPVVLLLLLTINSPKICPKRWSGCHTSSHVSKRCSSLCDGHRSQGAKSRSKWYSNVQIAFPHSRMVMIPSSDVRAFQPKIISSCSPNVTTSSPVFSRISGTREHDKNTPYQKSGPSVVGSCVGKLASRQSRCARIATVRY